MITDRLVRLLWVAITVSILSLSLLRAPVTVHAAASLVQTSTGVTNGGTSVSASFGSSPSSNNLLIAVCGARTSATITGPSGFSTAINQTGTPSQGIFYKVSAGTETNLSCSFSGSSNRLGIHIYEYSGLVTSSPLKTTGSTTGTSTSPSSGSLTTSVADTLIVSGITVNADTSFSGWTNSFAEDNDFVNGGQASSRSTYAGASRSVSAAGTYSTTATSGSGAWRGQIAAFETYASVLAVDIVNSSGTPVSSPSVSFSSVDSGFGCQSTTGSLGSASEKIRVTNTTANGNWTLSINATAGSTASWSSTYDFNDSGGCTDGGDADNRAGQLTANASAGTVTPQGGCSSSGVNKGSSASFVEGSVNSVTLLTASGSQTGCYYDLTGVSMSQQVPPETPAGSYNINMTITVVAN